MVALVLLTGLPLAGCGSGKNTDSWVGTFCGSGATLRSVLSSENDSIRSKLKITDLAPVDLKESLARGASNYVLVSAKQATRVKEAGEPSVGQGKEIEEAAVAKYAAIDEGLKGLQAQANALDASSRDTLAAGLGPYSQGLADASRDIAGSFQELQRFKGYAKLEKVSTTPDDYDTANACTRLRTVSP